MPKRPYVKRPSTSSFPLPATLESDFDNFLDGDLPHQVMDWILLPDWYAQFEKEYEEKTIRGEIYPDSTKSRYENTDSNMNFRASISSGIKKGDMIISTEDGQPYILDWDVELESNNAPSRALRCNFRLTVSRWEPDVTDDMGYLIEEGGLKAFVDRLPVNAYRYDGRPEFSASSGTAGISPNALTLLTCQLNTRTAQLRIGDKYLWGPDEYEIIDISRVGLDVDETYGTLKIQSKKTAGGIDYDRH